MITSEKAFFEAHARARPRTVGSHVARLNDIDRLNLVFLILLVASLVPSLFSHLGLELTYPWRHVHEDPFDP